MDERIFSRLLAAQNQSNHTVYDENWKVLRTWIKNPNAIDTMSLSAAEVKYLDKVGTAFLGEGIDGSTPSIVEPINIPLPQGVGVSQRIGNHVQATGIRLAMQVVGAVVQPMSVRVIIMRTPAIGTGMEFPVPIQNILALPADAATHKHYYALAPRVLEQQKSSGQMIYDNTLAISTGDAQASWQTIKTEIELDARVIFKSPDEEAITTNAYVLYILPASEHDNTHCSVRFMTRFLYTDS